MKLSIIVDIHNAEKFLEKSIECLMHNCHIDDVEYILIDGNSSDNSKNICLKYQKENKKVTYIRFEKYDVNEMRNAGMKYSSGEYLYFIDGANFLCDSFIDTAIKFLDAHSDYAAYVRNWKEISQNNITDLYGIFLNKKIGPLISACVFRKSAIKDILFEGLMCSDIVFSGKIIYANNYYYENSFESFIENRDHYNFDEKNRYRIDMTQHTDWILYTREKIQEYLDNK